MLSCEYCESEVEELNHKLRNGKLRGLCGACASIKGATPVSGVIKKGMMK